MYIFFDDINIFVFKDDKKIEKLPFDQSQIENIINNQKNVLVISDRNDFYFSFDELKNCSLFEKYQIIKCAKKNKHPNEEIIVFNDDIIRRKNCILQKIGIDTQNEIYKKIPCGIIPVEFFISKYCALILRKNSHKDGWWIYIALHNSCIRLIAGFFESIVVSRFFDKIQEKQITETLNYIKRYKATSVHLFFDKTIESAVNFYKDNEKHFMFYPIDALFQYEIPIKLFFKKPIRPIFRKSDFDLKIFQFEIFRILNLINIIFILICTKFSYDVFLTKSEIKKGITTCEVSDKTGFLKIKLDFTNLVDIKNFLKLITDSNEPFEIFCKVSKSLPEALRVQELLFEKHSLKLKLKISELLSWKFLKKNSDQILEDFFYNLKAESLNYEILNSDSDIIILVKKNEIKNIF